MDLWSLAYVVIFFLPTFFANASPILWKKINVLNVPIHEKYLWKNKTWRGLVLGVITWIFVWILLYYANVAWLKSSLLFYNNIVTAAILWWLQWFWALAWDAVESFIKRKKWIKPWQPLFFRDWVDYIIWGVIMTFWLSNFSLFQLLFVILIAPIASILANMLSYKLGWKEVWW